MLLTITIIDRSDLSCSIIGLRSIVRTNTKIESSIVMGINYYESREQIAQNGLRGVFPLGIGSGCLIHNAIRDSVEHTDAENYSIRDYIIVAPKNAVIPSGTVI